MNICTGENLAKTYSYVMFATGVTELQDYTILKYTWTKNPVSVASIGRKTQVQVIVEIVEGIFASDLRH